MNSAPATTRVIGVGNHRRRDDGVGPAVAAALDRLSPDDVRVELCEGDPLSLLDGLGGERRLILIDAVQVPKGPCRVHRIDARQDRLNVAFPCSSHAFGLSETLELAKTLKRLPDQTIVYAVEGWDFAHGRGLSPEAQAAAESCLAKVLAEVFP